MGKKIVVFVIFVFTALVIFGLAGCNCTGRETETPEYTIIYETDGQFKNISVEYGAFWSMPKPLPAKEGYTFSGLYDAPAGGVQYTDSNGVCLTAFFDNTNLRLYAQFEPVRYNIRLDYGAGSKNGDSSVTVTYGQDLPGFPSYVSVADKYYMEFLGWYTQANGGVKVAGKDGMPVIDYKTLADSLDLADGASLYAQFNVPTYTLTFYDADRTTVLQTTTAEHGSLYTEAAPTQTENGNRILSWYNWDGYTPSDATVTGAAQFYVASYECTLTYDYDYDGVVETLTIPNGMTVLKQPSRVGYTFAGWMDKSGMVQTSYNLSVTEDIKLTAKWTPKTYTVIYSVNPEEGTLSATDRTVTYGAPFTLAVPASLRDEYEFVGWMDESGNLLTDASGASTGTWSIDQNTTVSAKWKQITYTITLNANGGTNGGTATVVKGRTYTIPSSSRTGYTFKGWYNGTKLYSGDIVVTGNITLAAKWTANTYTVTLNANGGSVDSSTQTVTYGSTFTLPVPTKDGYVFVGWYDAKEHGNKITDSAGNSLYAYSTASGTTVYAVMTTNYVPSLLRESCKRDNGYNPSEGGTDNELKTHAAYELLQLNMEGSVLDSNGIYWIPENSNFNLSLRMLQDPGALPKSGSIGANWYANFLNSDTYSGRVYGVNSTLDNKKIGKGAYYIKITYSDGASSEVYATDFMSQMGKDSVFILPLTINESKTLYKIEIVVIYEVAYYFYDGLWHENDKWRSNWRCSVTLYFS